MAKGASPSKGRKIVAYPDIDGYATWIEKLAQFPDLHVTVSPILQRNATAENIEAHIDIADWFIRYRHPSHCHSERSPQGGVEESKRRHRIDFLKAARYISPEYHEELEALIEDLDLEFWGVERIEKTEEEKPP